MSWINKQPGQEFLVPPLILTHWLVKSVKIECGSSKTLNSLETWPTTILWVLGSARNTWDHGKRTTTGTGEREVEINRKQGRGYNKMPLIWIEVAMIASMDTRSKQLIKVKQNSIYTVCSSQQSCLVLRIWMLIIYNRVRKWEVNWPGNKFTTRRVV